MFDPEKDETLPPADRLPKLSRVEIGGMELRQAIEQVVQEFQDKEQDDFNENPSEDHPYLSLRVLRTWLYG